MLGWGGGGGGSVPLQPTHDIQPLSLVHISNDDLHLSLLVSLFFHFHTLNFLKSGVFVQKRILFANLIPISKLMNIFGNLPLTKRSGNLVIFSRAFKFPSGCVCHMEIQNSRLMFLAPLLDCPGFFFISAPHLDCTYYTGFLLPKALEKEATFYLLRTEHLELKKMEPSTLLGLQNIFLST